MKKNSKTHNIENSCFTVLFCVYYCVNERMEVYGKQHSKVRCNGQINDNQLRESHR